MEKHKKELKNSKILEMVNNLTLKAKEKELIKPVKEAFKDIPASREIHKGKKEYFCD